MLVLIVQWFPSGGFHKWGLAMAEQRSKTLIYRRAEWLDDRPKGTTLESCLRDAHNALKTFEDRTIIRDSGQCIRSAKKVSPRDGGIFVHLIADTPGERASVIPKMRTGMEEVEVGTAAPPDDSEFMDGDAFSYVREDHVCMCATGMRDGAIRLFLYEFFAKAKLGKHSNKFDLLKTPKLDKLKMLNSQGVKQIELRASVYQATAQYEKRKSNTSGVLRKIATHIQSVVGAEKEGFDDSLRVEVVIKTDERSRKHLTLGEKRIEGMAKDVLENVEKDDDFTITTNTGQKIMAHEIFVNEVVLIDTYGKSVKCQKAWDALLDFHRSLKSTGALGM